MQIVRILLADTVDVCALVRRELPEIFLGEIELAHLIGDHHLVGVDDLERLNEIVVQECSKREISLIIPLLVVHIDENTSPVRRRVADDGSELVGRAEDPLHPFEVFEADSLDDVRMVLDLA